MKTTTLRKTTLATAVSLAMTGSAFAGHDADDGFLLPIISTDDALTFVTIVNDPLEGDLDDFFDHTPVRYNLIYGTKAADAAQTDPCTHKNFFVDVTLGHLLQYEVNGGPDLPNIFGDESGQDLLEIGSGLLGFLIVESVDGLGFASIDEYNIWGEAVVINTVTGLQFAYSSRQLSDDNPPLDFDDVTGTSGEEGSEKLTSWYPAPGGIPGVADGVTTLYHALPLGDRQDMIPNVGGGISMVLRPETDPDNFGAFVRNERFISGVNPKALRCFAVFPREELLSELDHDAGGWMSLVGYTTDGFTVDDRQSYILHKIQTVPSSLLGQPVNVVTREVER